MVKPPHSKIPPVVHASALRRNQPPLPPLMSAIGGEPSDAAIGLVIGPQHSLSTKRQWLSGLHEKVVCSVEECTFRIRAQKKAAGLRLSSFILSPFFYYPFCPGKGQAGAGGATGCQQTDRGRGGRWSGTDCTQYRHDLTRSHAINGIIIAIAGGVGT